MAKKTKDQRKFLLVLSAILVVTTVLFTFQNCSRVEFEKLQESKQEVPLPKPTPPVCVKIESPDLQPVEKWRWQHQQGLPGFQQYNQVMSSPVVGDLNGDGVSEIAFTAFQGGNYTGAGVLRVLRGDTGAEVFSITNANHQPWGSTSPLIVDIDHDGKAELVWLQHLQNKVVAANYDGTIRWTASLPGVVSGCMGGPAAGDVDGDGTAEILVDHFVLKETKNGASYSIAVTPVGPDSVSYCTSFFMTVDPAHSTSLQIVTASGVYDWNSGVPAVLYPLSGGLLSAADIDPDIPGIEIVVTQSESLSAYSVTQQKMLWSTPLPIDASRVSYARGGPPNISDFDGDGRPDIAVASAVFYTVIDGKGKMLWKSVTNDFSSAITGSSLFDFNGDGTAEVIYSDEGYFHMYNGPDGKTVFKTRNPSGTLLEYPLVADVDGDGHSDLVVVMNNYHRAPAAWLPNDPDEVDAIINTGSGLRVFKSKGESAWMPTRKMWNQYSYFVNNIKDDLSATSSTPLSQNFFRQNKLSTLEKCR